MRHHISHAHVVAVHSDTRGARAATGIVTLAPVGPATPQQAVASGQEADGFEVTLRRTANPGEPMTDRDLRLPGQLRRIVRAHLNQWGIGVGITETAELLVSELVANTLQHGTDTSGEFRVHVWCAGQCVRMEVGNGGPLNPDPRPAVPPTIDAADLSESGRGLTLVDALADDWGISPDGALTWCVLAIPGGE